MKRFIYLVLAMGCLTGCSELRIIGAAAMNELRSEGINAEVALRKQPDVVPEEAPLEVKPVVVAKAAVTPLAKARDFKKGAWEHF
jgi:hypothetical protein